MVFKKKMNVMRFSLVDGKSASKISEKDVLEGLAEKAFDECPGSVKNSGFTTLEEPYTGTNFVESSVFHGDFMAAVFRRDVFRVPSSLMKREMQKKIDAYRKENPFVSRKTRDEFKEQIMASLQSDKFYQTTLTPFIFNRKTGIGYFFNTSEAVFSDFGDDFSRSIGFSIESKDYGVSFGFLSWMWWRVETNELAQPSGAEVSIGSRFSVGGGNGRSLSGRASESEIRLAVADGCFVKKMDIVPIDGKGMSVSYDGKISGLCFDPEDLPDKESASLLPLISSVEEAFGVLDAWAAEYRSNEENFKAFLESRWEWARPSICGATFEQV